MQPDVTDPARARLGTVAARLGPAGIALVIGALAGAVRLRPLLRGGGLTGLGNYDDGVYYSAGTAFLHGLMPYRDFVLLHPPGVVLLLSPFGLFGLSGHDALGFGLARLLWVALGVANTVLVARILSRLGLVEAAVGALFYATAYPAIYNEWTTLLETPPQTCGLVALLLLGAPDRTARGRAVTVRALVAGAAMGASATFKIWAAAAVLALIVWLVLVGCRRVAALVTAGAAAAATAVCLPFFAAAPASMWRMVVLDQLGRPDSSATLLRRVSAILGLGLHPRLASSWPLVGLLAALTVALMVLAARRPLARIALVLTVTWVAVLIASPSWFLHYPGAATGSLAVVVGAGAGALLRSLTHWRRAAGVVGSLAVLALVGVVARPLLDLRLGRPFPSVTLSTAAASVSGCVTADDPATLVEMNVLSRDLARHCPFVADLTGISYELASARGRWIARARDPQWQAAYLGYLRSGAVTLAYRYPASRQVSAATEAEVQRWPTAIEIGRYRLRLPR